MSKIGGFFLVLFAFIAGFLMGKQAQCCCTESNDDESEKRGKSGLGRGNKINNIINWSFNVNKN